MSGKWNGSLVSIDCGSVLGVFEGEISSIDIDNQTVSLINVSRNSIKCTVPEITLSTHDIKNLKLLKSSLSKDDETFSSQNSASLSAFVPASSSSKECVQSPLHDDSQKKKSDIKKKPTKRADCKKWLKERDEACFNAPLNSELLDTEFDFEKNLALFDKQKVFDEINALSKSDHVKLVDCNKRGNTAKYRHDENVLSGGFIPLARQISVPCVAEKEYVTDSGLTVPSVSVEFRKKLFENAEEVGFSLRVRLEMIGRAASEMVLQLLGGNHRLNPQNTHQKPTVVILCGSHIQGAQGINCGRHLANHCVNVTALTQLHAKESNNIVSNELDLFKLSGGLTVIDVCDMPSTVDIIIDALDGIEDSKSSDKNWHDRARKWSKQSKATLLYLDPPPDCKCEEKDVILAPALPFAFENEKCSLNICDIGLPKGIFYNSGCCYSSPFGSKFTITLYPKQE